jgi:hypothetical protein
LIRHRPLAGSSFAAWLDPSLAYPTASVRYARPYGPLFVRCDVCRRYARLYLAEIRDTDSRTKTFSCCRCGSDGALAISEPNTETGMTDYQLDQVDGPRHHLRPSRGSLGRLRRPIAYLPSTTGRRLLRADRLILLRRLVHGHIRVNGGGCFCAQVFRSPKYSRV